MKIHHFAIEVNNIHDSLEFYTEKLGFKIKAPIKSSEDGLYYYVNIDLGGSELELIQLVKNKNENQKSCRSSICPHIALQSFDLEKDLLKLKKRGVKIFDGPNFFQGDVQIATVLDPDNYRIDIGQLLN